MPLRTILRYWVRVSEGRFLVAFEIIKTGPGRVQKRSYDVGLHSFQCPKIRLRLPLRRD